MHKYMSTYPPASPLRNEDAERLFPYRTMSAEEYAAREGFDWDCFSFGEFVYPDPVLNEWIHTLDDIFFTPGRLTEARNKYLDAEAIARRSREHCQLHEIDSK